MGSFICKGDLNIGQWKTNVEAELKWEVRLVDREKEELKRNGEVRKVATVSILERKSSKELWPLRKGATNEKLDVRVDGRGKLLTIEITEVPIPRRTGNGLWEVSGGFKKSLACNADKLVSSGSRGETLYSKGMRSGGKGKSWIPHDGKSLQVSISLQSCENKGRVAECPLKVVKEIN